MPCNNQTQTSVRDPCEAQMNKSSELVSSKLFSTVPVSNAGLTGISAAIPSRFLV